MEKLNKKLCSYCGIDLANCGSENGRHICESKICMLNELADDAEDAFGDNRILNPLLMPLGDPIRDIVSQCTHYADGTRYCDFCSVDYREQHKEHCPLTKIKLK